jgi:hypothetical protein
MKIVSIYLQLHLYDPIVNKSSEKGNSYKIQTSNWIVLTAEQNIKQKQINEKKAK